MADPKSIEYSARARMRRPCLTSPPISIRFSARERLRMFGNVRIESVSIEGWAGWGLCRWCAVIHDGSGGEYIGSDVEFGDSSQGGGQIGGRFEDSSLDVRRMRIGTEHCARHETRGLEFGHGVSS